MDSPGEITRLIKRWQAGDKAAENELFEAIYAKLHAIAMHFLRTEAPGQTLGATALIHEVYLRFQRAERLDIAGSSHFLALAARVMRRILVDKARARRADKRAVDRIPLDAGDAFLANFLVSDAGVDEILKVDRALESLSKQSPRQVQIVELRYFAGFSEEESASALGISPRTVRREWQVARTRLRMAIDGVAGPA
jgi:RNA polymerase sigma factor (TIGR02999 family)